MAIKKCCIENCKSCSSRKEDVGVTYHKYPKNVTLHATWIAVTRNKKTNTNSPMYVCSRHFRKHDFRLFKETKYVLKSDAVPSIFPWTMDSEQNMEISLEDLGVEEKKELNNSKESEGENVDAIKSFIEEQEREIQEQKSETNSLNVEEQEKQEISHDVPVEDTMAVASSVMDMILSESESRIAKKKDVKTLSKQCLSAADKGNSMSLSVGSKVEAKDFGEFWHPAQILEVDYDEMEVLVHYENESKKHDEWISVSSPRLRPLSSRKETEPIIETPEIQANVSTKDESKVEDKPKLQFVAGERCLARWRDNRRFMATVSHDLGGGSYQIVFDDGFNWKCTISRLYKLKQALGPYDSPSHSSTESNPSPLPYGAGPSMEAGTSVSPTPAYHTHLFDPARDYLGSKSERREMKRKLNIKEIFNIGQKKKKIESPKEKKPRVVTERKPKILRKKIKPKLEAVTQVKAEVKTEVPDAVASIIGTVSKELTEPPKEIPKEEIKTEEVVEPKLEDVEMENKTVEAADTSNTTEVPSPDVPKDIESDELKIDVDSVPEEEAKLEKFENDNHDKHVEVIDRMKVVINKLEDEVEKISSPKPEVKKEEEIKEVKTEDELKTEVKEETIPVETDATDKSKKKGLSKVKKGKKLRLLQEKKVKKQVEKVKSELEEMKKQFEEMRKQMLLKTEELAKNPQAPESYLLPGEWCCKWVNGQPLGTVSELEAEVKGDGSKPGLPRRSVQVDDKRLPPGWTKHMVRRSFGNSAGKWDVVLVSPDNKRFHTKTDMRNFLENNPDERLKDFEYALLDFGVHLKLSRRLGWVTSTPGGVDDVPVVPLPAGTLSSTSPLVKRKRLSLKKEKKKKLTIKIKMPTETPSEVPSTDIATPGTSQTPSADPTLSSDVTFDGSTLEDGFVHVGALKVQVIDHLLRCPAEGCFKNFRNNTLLQMHIKHYHRELRKMMGKTPKVLDLAYARTMPTENELKLKCEAEPKTIKVKLPKAPKRTENVEHKIEAKDKEANLDSTPLTPVKTDMEKVPRSQDSPKLRTALTNKPVKRPRVLLPVRRMEPEQTQEFPPVTEEPDDFEQNDVSMDMSESSQVEVLDFETAISTHTVTKPFPDKKTEKKKKTFASVAKMPASEDEDWFAGNSDVETRSSFPRSGSPDSKTMETKTMQPISSESNEEQKDSNMYMYTENGERIKIVHMKREEIINCHCGFREEDGLMVQCELCLCWQHALCHNIQKESEVPEKYTCSICLNPRRGRRSQRFLHDQDRLYEGLLPGARPCESLRRSHELSGNLLRIEDALHALRVKYYVATKKDHPKLYLWAKDWENGELNVTQEKLNSDFSDLNVMISSIGKENLPIKPDEINNIPLDMRTPPSEEQDERRTQSLLSGLLSSPGGGSLDLPISTSELERLAKSVQEQEQHRVIVPQPEAAIENSACRERLLRHIQRCQVLIDARLDSIEAQVAELESQDPSFEDDETPDYFPRTKQTIQMLMRDLDTMEELGVIT